MDAWKGISTDKEVIRDEDSEQGRSTPRDGGCARVTKPDRTMDGSAPANTLVGVLYFQNPVAVALRSR